MEIILASSSPRRKFILTQIDLKFKVRTPKIDEEREILPDDVAEAAITLARAKAHSVIRSKDNALIVGADTQVRIDNQRFGKPKSSKEATEMLRALSGRVHEVITGVVILDTTTSKAIEDYEVTKVKFRPLEETDIGWYVSTGEPIGKAGGYAIQGIGALFIEKIDGDFYNVMGLPVYKMAKMFERLNHSIFEFIRK